MTNESQNFFSMQRKLSQTCTAHPFQKDIDGAARAYHSFLGHCIGCCTHQSAAHSVRTWVTQSSFKERQPQQETIGKGNMFSKTVVLQCFVLPSEESARVFNSQRTLCLAADHQVLIITRLIFEHGIVGLRTFHTSDVYFSINVLLWSVLAMAGMVMNTLRQSTTAILYKPLQKRPCLALKEKIWKD